MKGRLIGLAFLCVLLLLMLSALVVCTAQIYFVPALANWMVCPTLLS